VAGLLQAQVEQPVLGIGLELVAAQGFDLPGELHAVAAMGRILRRQQAIVAARGMQDRDKQRQRQGARQTLHI
jgi:hypothetical protein